MNEPDLWGAVVFLLLPGDLCPVKPLIALLLLVSSASVLAQSSDQLSPNANSGPEVVASYGLKGDTTGRTTTRMVRLKTPTRIDPEE